MDKTATKIWKKNYKQMMFYNVFVRQFKQRVFLNNKTKKYV